MKTISGYILTNILGWKIIGEFPDVKKSIVLFAPHTSYFDALYVKLYLIEIGITHIILTKKELFFFPMNIVMELYGSIPVRGVKDKNAIYCVGHMLEEPQDLHIILSPEGTIKKVNIWNKGFYYVANKKKVPIVVMYLDYKKKEIGIKGVINQHEEIRTVMHQINTMYKDVTAKHPEKFSIDLNI
ncbi:MAG: 1-acyl-sn-glycerol-3-phosphate acyltransferase [Paludibacter sp.]|nr:1-acyl-sn-glycerol-3-phosphate acyltransferase [Paludibacter sp.]